MSSGAPSSSVSAEDWFGQPKGLTILFLTEMWEVFCAYGMRVLLVYYMTKELHFARPVASLIYGLFSGCVYATPVLGGLIADRLLGRHKSVIAGGCLMFIGQIMLIVPALFFVGLAIIALGVGLFLPSLPSQIVHLYAPGDPRRTSAFSFYYIGKNLGALLATLICGAIGETYGWRWGFVAGAMGMLLGLVVYCLGQRWLPVDPIRVKPDVALSEASGQPYGRNYVSSVLLLMCVGLAVVLFRAAYEQTGNSLALWLDHGVDRRVGSWSIPMTWFQAINPALIFLMAPILAKLWLRRARGGKGTSELTKMATGAFLLGIAYVFLGGIAGVDEVAHRYTHWSAVMIFLFILTIGELYTLPIGLGVFARLGPPGWGATMVAIWYTTSFGGNILGGFVGAMSAYVSPSIFFLFASALPLTAAAVIALCSWRARAKGVEL